MFTLLFIFWRSFWRNFSRRKKRVGIIMSDRKLLLFFWGYQKVFDPKNNSFLLLFFCLSWHSRMTIISIRLSSAASSSSLIMLGFFHCFFITRNHKSILCNVWLWANSDHCCCFLFKCCCCFFLSIFFLSSFFHHSSPHFLPQDWFCKWKRNHLHIGQYLTRLRRQKRVNTMVFCYQNCSDLLWEKIVLVTEKNFGNSRLKAENLKIFSHSRSEQFW